MVTNLLTNPSFEATSGTVEVRRNHMSNPSFDSGALHPWNPASFGTGGAGTDVIDSTGGLFGPACRLVTVTTPGTAGTMTQAVSVPGGAPVSVGVVTTQSVYVKPSRTVNMVAFTDYYVEAGTTFVQSVAGPVTVCPANVWTRLSVTATAPATATRGRLNIGSAATQYQAGDTIRLDGALVEISPVLLPYFDHTFSPDPDLTPSATGTPNASPSVLTGVGVVDAFPNAAKAISSTAWSQSGARSMRVLPFSTTETDTFIYVGGGLGALRLGMQPGKTYTALVKVRLAAPLSGTLRNNARRITAWTRVGAGSYVTTTSPDVPNVAGVHEVRLTFTVPTGATEAFIRLYHGGMTNSGDVWWDNAALVEGVYNGPYFDGDTPNDLDHQYMWNGPPNASTSTQSLTPGLRVEGFTDAPVPRVGITLTGLDPVGPSVVTVWRSTAGGKRRKVRGWASRVVYGSDYAIDYEAPLGRPVTYDLQVISGTVIPARISDTVTLDVEHGYIQDPLLPLGAVSIAGTSDTGAAGVLRGSAFQELEYAIESSMVTVLGSNEPVALTGQRLAASGFDFSMLTHAAEQATALRNLLSATPLVLIRPLPGWGPLPDLIYTVPRVIEEPITVSYGGTLTRWALSGSSVAPPSIQVLVALWTYDQVAALWATYADAQAAADAAAATYLDDQRDPTKGV